MEICAAIPAFNNQRTIGEVIVSSSHEVSHVVVVDDGSTDQTALIAKERGADVISVPKNRGKGNALRLAFRYALDKGFDAIITLDADLQHDPAEIPKFLERYREKKSKIIIGNRLLSRGHIPRIRYGPNKIGAYTFSWLIGQPVPDSQCGFRLYDRDVIKNIHILNDGFEAEADILLRAGKRGYSIDFVQIRTIYFSKRENGTVSYYRPVKDTFRISIIFLMNLFWRKR